MAAEKETGNLAGARAGRTKVNRRTLYIIAALALVALAAIIYFVTVKYTPHDPKKPLPPRTMTKPEQQPVY